VLRLTLPDRVLGGRSVPVPDLDDVRSFTLHNVARGLDTIPDAVVERVTGRTEVDGQVLDPHLGLILATEKVSRGREARTPAERRADIRRSARVAAGAPVQIGEVRDLTVTGAAGSLRARHYRPAGGGEGRPLVLFLHGGGWVCGDLDTHDQPCRVIAKHADVQVLAVDYRLAPEHPFPAGVEDSVASYAWALDRLAAVGASGIAVAGDSAGGNLAAVVSQTAKDEGMQLPVAQLLIYPGADAAKAYPSKKLFGEGFFLTKATMDWYLDTYAPNPDRHDPRLSPIHAKDLSGLPPTVVTTAAFDPLRDEGEAYAAALRDAGVPVVLRRAPGLVHGYFNMGGIHRASRRQVLGDVAAFSELLSSE
jgi:acetyl esterase